MLELKNLAKYRRYLLDESNLLVVCGNIAPVLAGMHAYNARYKIEAPGEDLNGLITELLAGAALSAVSLPDRESWGWSLTFEGMDVGFFVGVEPEGMICLRVVDADGKKASGMIQRQKAGLPLTQSHITPGTRRPADAVKQYFEEGVQSTTRVGIRKDGEGVLVQPLPGGNLDAVKNLDGDALPAFIDDAIGRGNVRETGEVLVFYECRCSEEMITRMIETMKESDRRDMFGDLRKLEIECPRCGRQYTVKRNEMQVH